MVKVCSSESWRDWITEMLMRTKSTMSPVRVSIFLKETWYPVSQVLIIIKILGSVSYFKTEF